MTKAVDITPVKSQADLDAVASLFQAYAASLSVDLAYQNFDQELAGLPGAYEPPGGELFIARSASGTALGCVALRLLQGDGEGAGEMKRLFLTPAARGRGVGRALTQAVIDKATDLGCRELRLDTLPDMTAAIGLYEAMGFSRIDPYYAPTPPGTVFMALTL
ncbi:GNAT family N-acetyltransferase [Brevundimonas sp.]|uniref:GNAT family N-acetyltransferase n=1 Tax=Brevundimonas sp. TaxID=1871086 RepID=UPI00391AFEF7